MTRFATILEERTDMELVRAINEYPPEDASVAMTELVKRRVRDIQYSLDQFNMNADRYTRRIRMLTWAVALLVLVLAVPLLKPFF